MGRFRIRDRGISTRAARQLREGILLGELSYNFKIKGDIKAARRVMLEASKSPKYTYLSALHTLANRLSCNREQDVV